MTQHGLGRTFFISTVAAMAVAGYAGWWLNNALTSIGHGIGDGLAIVLPVKPVQPRVEAKAKGDRLPVSPQPVREYFGPHHSFDVSTVL